LTKSLFTYLHSVFTHSVLHQSINQLAKADLRVVGPAAIFPRYLVSGGTKILTGEPIHNLGTLSSGALTVNTMVRAAVDTPIIAAITTSTHKFGGIANEDAELVAAGTVKEQFLNSACPVPNIGRIRGKAETEASVDTLTELALLIGDAVLFDYAATGASDGGPLYTIKNTASADTSGLEIVGGNTALSTLDVVVDSKAYRTEVS